VTVYVADELHAKGPLLDAAHGISGPYVITVPRHGVHRSRVISDDLDTLSGAQLPQPQGTVRRARQQKVIPHEQTLAKVTVPFEYEYTLARLRSAHPSRTHHCIPHPNSLVPRARQQDGAAIDTPQCQTSHRPFMPFVQHRRTSGLLSARVTSSPTSRLILRACQPDSAVHSESPSIHDARTLLDRTMGSPSSRVRVSLSARRASSPNCASLWKSRPLSVVCMVRVEMVEIDCEIPDDATAWA
jgi:hypothetical protein